MAEDTTTEDQVQNCVENDLYDIVFDTANAMASTATNNNEEIDFLLVVCGWSVEEINARLAERHSLLRVDPNHDYYIVEEN